jgi:xylose dehydrogenase (NAD/NADP)
VKKNAPTRWGIVGLGAQGERLANALKTAKRPLVGVAGNDATHVLAFARRFEARPEDLTALAQDEEIDAVCVASKNSEHVQQVIAALKGGKAVLCEKPMALTLVDGEKILRAARRTKRYCAVDFHLRMHPAFQEAREMIRRGTLGDLRFIEMHWSIGSWDKSFAKLPAHMRWREDFAEAGGGALMARGVHLFDLIRFITGQEIRAVNAYADGDIDRTTAGFAYLDTGAVASVVTSKVLPGAENRIALYGSKGSLILTNIFLGDARAQLMYANARGTKKSFRKTGNLYAAVFKEFEKGERGLLADVSDGLAVMRITKAWQESSRTGRRTAVR